MSLSAVPNSRARGEFDSSDVSGTGRKDRFRSSVAGKTGASDCDPDVVSDTGVRGFDPVESGDGVGAGLSTPGVLLFSLCLTGRPRPRPMDGFIGGGDDRVRQDLSERTAGGDGGGGGGGCMR